MRCVAKKGLLHKVLALFGPLLFVLCTLGAALAWAEEGHHAEFEPILSAAMFWRTVNFLLLFAILYKFTAKPVRDFFANRRESILTSLEEARRSKEEAEARYQELSQRLADRDREFEEIRRSALENAEKAKEQILADARDKARRIQEKAQASMEQELKKARESLKREAAELALKLSEERLKKEITPDDHRRFLEDYLAGLR